MEASNHSTVIDVIDTVQLTDTEVVETNEVTDDDIDMSTVSVQLKENLLSHFRHYDSLYYPSVTEDNEEFVKKMQEITSLSLLKHEDLRPLVNSLFKSYNKSTKLKMMKDSNLQILTHSPLTFVGIDDLKAVNKLRFETEISKTRFKKQLDVILTVVINKYREDLKTIHPTLWFLGAYLLRLDLSQYEVWFELESYQSYSNSLIELIQFYFTE